MHKGTAPDSFLDSIQSFNSYLTDFGVAHYLHQIGAIWGLFMRFFRFRLGSTAELTKPSRRKYTRKPWSGLANWDFFTGATGTKTCVIENLSPGGCLIRSSEPIQNRRWIRLILKDERGNLVRSVIGWVVRFENDIDAASHGRTRDGLSYRYGIQFIPTASWALGAEFTSLQFPNTVS